MKYKLSNLDISGCYSLAVLFIFYMYSSKIKIRFKVKSAFVQEPICGSFVVSEENKLLSSMFYLRTVSYSYKISVAFNRNAKMFHFMYIIDANAFELRVCITYATVLFLCQIFHFQVSQTEVDIFRCTVPYQFLYGQILCNVNIISRVAFAYV